jgi:hypothetical protein
MWFSGSTTRDWNDVKGRKCACDQGILGYISDTVGCFSLGHSTLAMFGYSVMALEKKDSTGHVVNGEANRYLYYSYC